MKMRYMFYNIRKNRLMTLFILVQIGILFFIIIAMISAILSRAEKYIPVKKWMKQQGVMIGNMDMGGRDGQVNLSIRTGEELENYLKQAKVVGSYSMQMYFEGIVKKNGESDILYETNTIGYDDALLSCYTPKLASGRWLREQDKETEEIEVVLAIRKGGNNFEVGDQIPLWKWNDAGEPIKATVSARVVGILADGADYLGMYEEIPKAQDTNFRNLYTTFRGDKAENTIAFVSRKDIEQSNQWSFLIENLCFITYDKDITKKNIRYNEDFINYNGSFLLKQDWSVINKNSEIYIYSQTDIFIPIIVGLLVLTIMSSVSNTAISMKQNMREYAIFYIHGLTWKSCLWAYIKSMIILQTATLFVTILFAILCEKRQIFRSMVFSIGVPQIGACVVLIVFFSFCSLLVEIVLIGRSSARDVWRESQ